MKKLWCGLAVFYLIIIAVSCAGSENELPDVLTQPKENLAGIRILTRDGDEDVDVIGLSFLQGAHLVLAPVLIRELKKNGIEDIPVIVGGIIPRKDIPKLKDHGITEVFLPGSGFEEIANFVQSLVGKSGK